jgi:hypothetical protein
MVRPDRDEGITMTRVSDRRRVGSVVLRALITAVFLAAAGMKFAAVPFEVAGFARFGYPVARRGVALDPRVRCPRRRPARGNHGGRGWQSPACRRPDPDAAPRFRAPDPAVWRSLCSSVRTPAVGQRYGDATGLIGRAAPCSSRSVVRCWRHRLRSPRQRSLIIPTTRNLPMISVWGQTANLSECLLIYLSAP